MKRQFLAYLTLALFIVNSLIVNPLMSQIHIGSASQPGNTTGSASSTGTSTQPALVGVSSTGQPVMLLWRSSYFQQAFQAFKTASTAARQSQQIHIGQTSQQPNYAAIGQDVINQYKTALDAFVKVYQDPTIMSDHSTPHVIVDGTSQSNYIVVIINDMLNAFTSNINQLKNSVIKLIAAGQPYQQVVTIITEAVQSYMQAAQSVAGYVQKNWDALYTPFIENLQGTVFSVYAFVLDALSQQAPSTLTPATIAQAGQYYAAAKALWSKDLAIPGYDSADDALTKITSAVGTIYLAGVQNAFNSMKIEPNVQTLTDVIGAQSPNRVLLAQATSYIQALAQIYTGIDELSDLQENNSALATSLTQASSALDSALQQSTVFDQAASAVNSAVPLLRAGGAAWYADHVDRIARLLTGNYYISGAQQLMTTFANTYKQRIDTLNKVITTTDTSNQDNLSDFFNALMAACGINDTTDSSPTFGYENAAAFYQGAEAAAESPFPNGPLISQAQLAQATAGAQMLGIQSLAAPCGNAAQLVAGALTTLFGSSTSDVSNAQIAITQALPLARQSDAAYKQLKKTLGASQATRLLPFYGLFPNSSLEDFIGQYAAHIFRVLAEKSTDTALSAEYYLAAFSYNQYLTSEVQADIASKLKNFTSIVTNAQTSLSAAQSQDSDYKNQKTPVDDSLLGAWNTALTQCLAVYTMSTATSQSSFAKSADLYPQCLQAYLKSYALATTQDPVLPAVLNYRLYLYTVATKSKETAAPILKIISSLVAPLFTAAESALKNSSGTGSSKAQDNAGFKAQIAAYTALQTAQNNLNALATQATTALQDQQRATPKAALTALITTSSTENKTSYSSKLISSIKAITIPDITASLAQMYQAYGDWALNQAISAQQSTAQLTSTTCAIPQDYNGTAMTAYAQAAQNYQAVGNTQLATQMQTLSNQQQMLYGADIIGNALEAAAPDASLFSSFLGDDWPAYAQYFLNPWILPLPTDGSLSDAEAALAGDQATNNESLINLAAAFYLYRHLQADGEFPGFAAAGYDLLDTIQDTKSSFGDYASYVKDAQAYKTTLTNWTKTGLTLPDNSATSIVKTSLNYYTPTGKPPALISCNLPVPAIPQTTSQPVDPTALMFYTSAFNQYSAFNGTNSQQLEYIQNKLASIKKSITTSYISEAYALVQKINYMLGNTVNSDLIKILIADQEEADTLNKYKATFTAISKNSSSITSLDDSSSQITTLSDGISLLQDYYALAVTLIDTIAAGAEQPGAQASSTSSSSTSDTASTTANTTSGSGDAWPEARALVGYLYEQQADNIAQYLLGDPTADKFQSLLNAVSQYYVLAQGSYTQANRADLAENAQLKVAQLFEKIAEFAVQQKLYIAAVPFINAAQDQYTKLATSSSQSSSSTGINYQQKSIYMGLLELVALFNGATEYFIEWYTTRWSTPITFQSGATVASFDALKSLQGTFAATQEETDFYNTLKSNLLDSLLYYSQLQTEINNQMKNWAIAAPQTQSPVDSSTSSTAGSSNSSQNITPVDPVIAAYTANTLAQGESIADYLKQGTVSPDTIRTFFEGMLLNGSGSQVDQLVSGGTSSTQFAQALNLTSEWAGMIYDALATLYIQDYVGITCPPDQMQQCVESQFLDLKQALQAEAQDIIAPAQQYVG